MRIKKLAISLFAFLMFSGVLMTTVSATAWAPSLPPDPATIKITNPYTTPLQPSSYPFIIDLSNVDPGFDITDGIYNGWCVDIVNVITRLVQYDVMLYSSYDEMAPIPDEDWEIINYIINHKLGTGCDVQAAIWYFINGGAYWWVSGDPFNPSVDPEVLAMVADASLYGPTYEPGEGDILAIVCVPVDEFGEPTSAQTVIIELQIRGTGKVTGGGQCIVGANKKIPSASFGFNAMWFSRDASPKGEINYVDHITGKHYHVHDLDYLYVWETLQGNKPMPLKKAIFGGFCTVDGVPGGYIDVYVEDNGEPGKNDKFLIMLDGTYLGGSGEFFGELGDDPILAGNIQIHKPPK